MALEIAVGSDLHDQLVSHLRGSDIEEVAFLAGYPDPAAEIIEVFDLLTLRADDFAIQTDYHVRLTDEGRGRVIRWAHERSATLIEAHAHRSGWPAEFSPSDMSGLGDWVPHIRWRLQARPYAALVFGDDSFDGLSWRDGSGAAEPVAGLRVGGELLEPTGLSHGRLMAPRKAWDR